MHRVPERRRTRHAERGGLIAMGLLTGPITGGAHGWPFGAAMQDLDAVGYVEEEYFIEGDATRYALANGTDYSFDGRWSAEDRDRAPFRSRLLVRRPLDAARFNGTVIVNWNNVTLGFESLNDLSAEVIDGGYAWVGASVQKVSVEGFPPAFGDPLGLAVWDPERYGTLSIDDDDLSFDIFTQIAEAVGSRRPKAGLDPMGGLDVDRLLAYGSSQSGCRLATYYNAVQPLAETFDGFLIAVYPGGGGARIDSRTPPAALDQVPDEALAVVNLLPFSSHQLRDDLAAPLLVLNSETEAGWYFHVRQPDTDTYRLWEVAGAAHSGGFGGDRALVDARLQREFGEVPARRIAVPADENPSTLSFAPVTDAAVHHLNLWASGKSRPPVQARIEFAGEPAILARDEHGNAVGGIRVPDFAVPTASHRGESPEGVPDLTGSSVPFSPEKLRELYPDDATYLARYDDAVQHGLDSGFLLERDAARLRQEAAGRSLSTDG